MKTSFYSENELKQLGLKSYGKNVLISRFARLFGEDTITVGNNVRIDDFCIISGRVEIGSYVHIAAGVYFFGVAGITISDFSAISAKCNIYSATDDYGGDYFTSPQFPSEYRNVIQSPIIIEKHVIIGAGTTVLPGVLLAEGAAVGSMSLVNCDLEQWGIYAGIPARLIKKRSMKLLELEQSFRKRYMEER